jgi:hypothetical protein
LQLQLKLLRFAVTDTAPDVPPPERLST